MTDTAKAGRKEASRPTSEEMQEMDDFAYELLSRCLHKSQIKQQFYEKYDVTARTVEKYLARARERLAIEAAKGKDQLKAESVSFYLAMIRSQDSTPREKILARERIDRLFGLDTPQKVALTDPAGEKEYAGLSDTERAERVAGILERARRARTQQADSDGTDSESA